MPLCYNNFVQKQLKKIKNKWWGLKLLYAKVVYGFPAKRLKIVGITGTNGKTTTAKLLYEVCMSLGFKTGFIGTTGTYLNGQKLEINRKIPTTPDSVTLTKIFSKMQKKGCEYVFMEVSSHAMDQNRVAGIKFAGGVFTNLTQDHLDYHKTMHNYFLAKKKFFQILGEKSFALSNIDDEYGAEMLKDIKAKKYTYGIENNADFKAEIKKIDFSGIELLVSNKGNKDLVKAKLLGKFNAYNLLAIFSVCNLLHFDTEKVLKILESVTPPEGRFDYFVSKENILAVVDYAHTPDAIKKVLDTARGVVKDEGKIISVFGCGGDRDPMKRRIMGKVGAELSDIAIFTSDNPRSENPNKIIEDMRVDLTLNLLNKVKILVDRREAIKEAVNIAKSGDIIMLLGKGHETYQEIKGVKYPFSDMEELKKLLD